MALPLLPMLHVASHEHDGCVGEEQKKKEKVTLTKEKSLCLPWN